MEEASYQYTSTQDWFSHNIPSWKTLINEIKKSTSSPRALEIGSWEGRSAVFLLTELCNPGGFLVCIDHFDLFATAAGRKRYDNVQHNLRAAGNGLNYRIIPQFSLPALMSLLEEEIDKDEAGFDWVYIDGSHKADDTFLDGELSWRLAKKGAILIFDDYQWDTEPEDSMHHPKRGIDAFLQLHEGEYTKLSGTSDYQVVLRKLVDMRIGFLVHDKGSNLKPNDAFSYGINLALTIDSSFSMPAAVALHSAVDNTPGRISIYIVDCGLTEDDKTNLHRCLPRSNDVTMSFLPLPKKSCAAELGPTWAKLDLHHILPVERVLYLDADTLVWADLRPLWETSIQDIGAAPDIGYPMGHDGMNKHPYFNAGVILMNLTKIKDSGDKLLEVGRSMRQSKYRDQDVFNFHFQDWCPLSLRWNAQGLGTYAQYPSAERNKLKLREMEDPAIVHFTGPVNPSVVQVLNPYVQPTVAKPWGYMGSPGHPFAKEWWEVLAKTPYAWYATGDTRILRENEAIEKVITETADEFRKRVRDRERQFCA